ncbi:MAG: DUF418 domain-containing protein, partial [Proteobacteria bacterium]|nr:DUF418 domain-containing protein [Pseudomonadota bacterium]
MAGSGLFCRGHLTAFALSAHASNAVDFLPQQAEYVRMPVAVRIGPTDPGTRIKSVDMVRGFALFGVLLVNMYNFGAYSTEWTGIFDHISFSAMHSVFETKSWRLFSTLFGFGFALQMLKAEAQAGGLWFYFRRLVILFIIGMAHALFYEGDVLMLYAMLGMILIAFRRLPKRALLVLTFVLLAVFPVGNVIVSLSEDEPVAEAVAQSEKARSLAERREGHPYLGSLEQVFERNARSIPPRIWSIPLDSESSLAIFAMFLLGLYVGRSRIVHDIPRHLPLIRRVFHWGIGIGVTSAISEWVLTQYFGYSVFRENTASTGIRLLGDILFAYGSTALALGYAAGIILLAQNRKWIPVLRPLENLGKMALTVYLLSTLMFTTLFLGYGFG